MNQLKNSIIKHALNETDLFNRIRTENQRIQRKIKMRRNAWISLGVAAAMVMVVVSSLNILTPSVVPTATGTTAVTNGSAPITTSSAPAKLTNENLAYAMVSIDINPSFELYTDENGIVTEVVAVNDDAKTYFSVDNDSLTGMKIGQAVKKIIVWAKANNYFKPDDGEDNFALVTVVNLKESKQTPSVEENSANSNSIGHQIKQELEKQDVVDALLSGDITKIEIIKATLQEKHEADKNGIPLGLYVINGMIDSDFNIENGDQLIPLSQFVKDKKNLEKMSERALEVKIQNENRKADKENDENSTSKPETPATSAPGQVNK